MKIIAIYQLCLCDIDHSPSSFIQPFHRDLSLTSSDTCLQPTCITIIYWSGIDKKRQLRVLGQTGNHGDDDSPVSGLVLQLLPLVGVCRSRAFLLCLRSFLLPPSTFLSSCLRVLPFFSFSSLLILSLSSTFSLLSPLIFSTLSTLLQSTHSITPFCPVPFQRAHSFAGPCFFFLCSSLPPWLSPVLLASLFAAIRTMSPTAPNPSSGFSTSTTSIQLAPAGSIATRSMFS